jgi:signal transduction histidine kinase
MKIFNWVFNFGVDDRQDFYDRLKYRTFNQVLIAIMFALGIMIVSDIIQKNETFIYSVLALLLTLVPLLLQYFHRQLWAALFFCTVYPFLLFVVSIFYGEEMNINYVYFAFVIIVLLAFENAGLKISLSVYIFLLQLIGIYYTRYYGSIIEKDIPLLDGILILILPTLGVGILIVKQVGAIKDLYDQQKRINAELEIKNQQLIKLISQNDSKNRLLAIIAHDLKGPAYAFNNLTKNFAYLVKKERPKEIEKWAHNFEAAGTKIYYTISNLLNWVISQSENIVSIESKFPLAFLLQEVVESLDFQNREKKVIVEYAPGSLPELATDRNILKIILFNILHNAVKFSEPGGTVLVEAAGDCSFDVVRIIDNGPGMDAETIAGIQNTGTTYIRGTLDEKGHGIGLKTCLVLVRYLGGRICIESEWGKGSVFGIYLPK